jgi:hypothetical protein
LAEQILKNIEEDKQEQAEYILLEHSNTAKEDNVFIMKVLGDYNTAVKL